MKDWEQVNSARGGEGKSGWGRGERGDDGYGKGKQRKEPKGVLKKDQRVEWSGEKYSSILRKDQVQGRWFIGLRRRSKGRGRLPERLKLDYERRDKEVWSVCDAEKSIKGVSNLTREDEGEEYFDKRTKRGGYIGRLGDEGAGQDAREDPRGSKHMGGGLI